MTIPAGSTIKTVGAPSNNRQLVEQEQELDDLLSQVEVTSTGDDKGTAFTEQVSVGKPAAGRELVAGEGDSYPVIGAWHADYANISGLTVTGATDVTTILQSDSASTTPLFDGTIAGKCMLVMSDVARFGGVKVKMDTAGTVEPASVTAEYLQDNTPTWISSPYMATDADFPYTQLANVIGGCSSCSEQWRFGFDPDNVPPTWDEVTMNINGTDYTGRWAIIRLTAGITLDPVLEQLKLHTNRWECNADGNTEYFGRSRYPKDLQTDDYGNVLKNPTNNSIPVSSGMTMLRIDNEFNNSVEDGRILVAEIPEGMDTSIPITVTVDWYPNDTLTGDVELELSYVKARNGFTFDGTGVENPTIPSITSVSNESGVRKVSSFKFLVDDVLPGDSIIMSVFRDATGTNLDDTFGGPIVYVKGRAVGYFWRP
jgi:hypothetical protein